MNTSSFQSERASENVSVDQASDVVAQIQALKLNPSLLAVFGEQISGGGSMMVPLNAGQDNGSALWVDTTQNLVTLGVDPANDKLYLWVWIEAKKHYCCVGDIIRELANNGNNMALAIE